jgi:hypothetical protein
MPSCGFGNRVLFYYNLRQESKSRDRDYFCVHWEGHQFFQGELLGNFPPSEKYEKFNFCLGERFFDDSGISSREVFKLKNVPTVPPKTCAIHFRGTDFHSWNPESILKKDYYLESIEEVSSEVENFVLFTDDHSLDSYRRVVDFFGERDIKVYQGQNTNDRRHYISDFSIMTECDYLISSPSTYCLSSGFIGKHKKIIHSKEWVLKRAEKNDMFWVNLREGGNEDYKLWKLV